MRLGKGNHAIGQEGHDVDVHVVAHVSRVHEAGCGPAAFGIGHGSGRNLLLVGDKGSGRSNALDCLMRLRIQ